MTEIEAETRHSAASLRFILPRDAGLLEARLAPHFSALIYHLPDCDGESCNRDCDAEMTEGDDLLAAYLTDGDAGMWRELLRFSAEEEDRDE